MGIIQRTKSVVRWPMNTLLVYFSMVTRMCHTPLEKGHFPELTLPVLKVQWPNWRQYINMIVNPVQNVGGWIYCTRIRLTNMAIIEPYSKIISCAVAILRVITAVLSWCLCCGTRKQKASDVRKGVARLWLTQAEHDHQSAMNDMHHDTPAFEWVSIKCQQASEKAIKAAIMMKDPYSRPPGDDHDIIVLCRFLDDRHLKELATMLHGHIGVASRMRYSDLLRRPTVARDVYTEQIATYAWDITGEILTHVQQQYMGTD